MPQTIMIDKQIKPDYAWTFPALSGSQRLDGLADPVQDMRARPTRIKIATLNSGTLATKNREIANMMETRWTGAKSGGKSRFVGDSVNLYYSRGLRPRNGVAICLQEKWQDKVVEVTRKSNRIVS